MADQDIFGLTQTTASAEFARGDTFILSKEGTRIGLAQNISVAYSRPLQPVYSLGTSTVAMTTGRPQGQLNIARVIGKIADAGEFSLIKLLGEAFFKISGEAVGGTLSIQPLAGKGLLGAIAGADTSLGFTLKGCFVVGEQFGGSAQDVVIIESVQIQFIAMVNGLESDK